MIKAPQAPRSITIRWAESGSTRAYWVGGQTSGSIGEAIEFALRDGSEVALVVGDEVTGRENLLRQAVAAVTAPDIDLVYFRDLGNPDGYLQPEWSADSLLHIDYFRDAFLIRLSRFQDVDIAQIRELTLLLRERVRRVVTTTCGQSSEVATENTAVDGAKQLLQQYCDSNRFDIEVAQDSSDHLHLNRRLSSDPLVSIIIPIRDNDDLTRGAPMTLATIVRSLTYPNLEILLSAAPTINPQAINEFCHETLTVLGKEISYKVVQDAQTRSFPGLLNRGAQAASAAYLLFVMPWLEYLSPAAVRQLIGHSIEPAVGAVAPLIRRNERFIDNIGVSICKGTLVPIQRDTALDAAGPRTGERSAITSQCLAIAQERLELVGGFSEEYESHLFDIDLCLKLRRLNYRVITDLEVEATSHYESLLDTGAKDLEVFWRRWSNPFEIDDYVRGPLIDQSHARL